MSQAYMKRYIALRRLGVAAAALGLALAVTGCESFDKLNPFSEKEKILPGQRQAVFPEGVPGVDYNAPVPQPASPGGITIEPSTPDTAPGGGIGAAKNR